MLKRLRLTFLLLTAAAMLTGCSVINLRVIRWRLQGYVEDLFSQSTITMPVFVTATSTPTVTPPPTITPTPTRTLTPTPTVQEIAYSSPTFEYLNTAELPLSQRDAAKGVSDVTVPDDTVLQPGQLFIKSWRLTNSGSNTWTEGTKLMMSANYNMGMPTVVKAIFLKPNDWIDFTPGGWGTRLYNVGPGTQADLAVILRAPDEPGSYQIDFRIVNDAGEIITTQFWMRFSVRRPTETPTPEPVTGTPTPEIPPYEWSGRWMVREPFHTEEIIPANAWLDQNEDELTGFLYNAQGDPIIIRGALSAEGRTFTGEIFYPWQKQTTPVSWRMQMSRDQFYAITSGGLLDESAVCGGRDGKNLPASCALPAEG